MIKALIEGDSLEGLAEELLEDLEPRVMRAADAGARIFEGEVRRTLSRVGPPVEGGPPAKRTGELQESMKALPAKKRGNSVRARVGVWHESKAERHRIAKKAAALEYGGTDGKGRYHPPYPFMRPAEEAKRQEIMDAIDAELERPQ